MPNRKKSTVKAGKAFAGIIKNTEMEETARRILDKYGNGICENCLGRQFGQISGGMTNKERGLAIREMLSGPHKGPPSGKCEVCAGLFQKGLVKWSARAVKMLKGIEYSSFVVGSRLSRDLISREERIWELFGISHCEPIKTELNRELGKAIWRKTRKKVDELVPDVLVLFDLDAEKIILQINPLFIYGEYKKLKRGIPQTKWDQYSVSVEDIVAKPIMRATRGSAHAMHGAGREDIDALCLDWRPFVLEISEPKKRRINLKKMGLEINKSRRAKVRNLRHSNKKEVADVKSARYDKTYRLLVRLKDPIEKEKLNVLKSLIGTIRQKTPERVVHRRADIMRSRKVKKIRWKTVTNKKLEFEIKGEAGLYVKELVTGDNGRTTPNVSQIIDNPAKVLELDVIKIHKNAKNNRTSRTH